jgi:N-acetyl sugar amidotransferase
MNKNNKIIKKRFDSICSKCVMDTSDPNILFDNNGVCDHCHEFENYVKPNWHKGAKGKFELEKVIEKIKKSGKNKEFNCLLGLSGGVDSSYMLHMVVNEFGLRPLVFHVDGGWNSELAVHNINVMIDKLNLDLYTEVINWEEMKNFQLAFFKSGVPHLDVPQDHAFIATLYQFAEKYKIKYILNGGNFSTECVQYPMEWFYYGTDMVHNKEILKKFGTIKMETYPFSSVFRHKIYLKYFKGVNVIKPLDYVPFIKKEALDLLEKKYGWKPYPQKHFESRFTKFYESYWLPERFGYDTRKIQYSSLILTGQMEREEAIESLKTTAYNPDTIQEEFNYIAAKLGITSSELHQYFKMPKKYYWDYKNQKNIFRLGAKVLNLIGVEKVKKRKK